ncbi:MAG TPA: phosphatase PAP2 family protein [Burkholderiales bacterium]|nr:phosphatase PAP2 family protein [Burkholderiales bacterium]
MKWTILVAGFLSAAANAGGGPLGIDHRWNRDDNGIWKTGVQDIVRYGSLAAGVGLALWEGGETRLGRTAWQSIDSVALTSVIVLAAKPAFGRERPRDTDDPDQWRKGGRSFPSGEVSQLAALVTPYVLEYGHENPAVYALELLPAYAAIARMKVQEHWQTDVLAAFAIGTASGYFAHRRSPMVLGVLPGGFSVGIKKRF